MIILVTKWIYSMSMWVLRQRSRGPNAVFLSTALLIVYHYVITFLTCVGRIWDFEAII